MISPLCPLACFRNERVNTWSHPDAFLNRSNLVIGESELAVVLKEMGEQEIALEMNRKCAVPEDMWLELADHYGVPLIRGSDLHAVEDLSAV